MTRNVTTLIGLAAAMLLLVNCVDVDDELASRVAQTLDETSGDEGAGGSDGDEGEGGDDGDEGEGGDDGDEGEGGDDGDEGAGGDDGGDEDDTDADLPYNVNLQLGDSFQLTDAFLMKGSNLPAAVIELTMTAPPEWRLVELQNDTPYVVNQDDCDHEGNHGTGRDRYEITWENQDGSVESDHFTIRYCN